MPTSWLDMGSFSICHIGAPRAIAELYAGEQSADVWGTGCFPFGLSKLQPHPHILLSGPYCSSPGLLPCFWVKDMVELSTGQLAPLCRQVKGQASLGGRATLGG